MEAWLGRRQPALVYREQQGGDLGARMANALSDAFKEGTKTAVVVREIWYYTCTVYFFMKYLV